MNCDGARLQTIIGAVALAVGVMTGCAVPPASSEAVPEQARGSVLDVEQVAGFWALRGPDGARCDVSLASVVIDAVRPVLVETCSVASLAKARSWRATADGFDILDAAGGVLMTFRRTGEDVFASTTGGLSLTRAPLF